jgi:hypothetical protein
MSDDLFDVVLLIALGSDSIGGAKSSFVSSRKPESVHLR